MITIVLALAAGVLGGTIGALLTINFIFNWLLNRKAKQ
nr:MAG TPA: Cell-membrane associated Mucin15 [Caudoviricetes sp.]